MLLRYLLFISISSLCLAVIACGPAEQVENSMQVLMRDIGNEVLWSVRDSTSRVLPVRKSNDTYIITFEKQFSIDYDSLVIIVSDKLTENGINRFHVQLTDCKTDDIFLAFAVNSPEDANVPCLGRETADTCYQIEITPSSESISLKTYLPFAVLAGIFIILFLLFRKRSAQGDTESGQEASQEAELLPLGKYIFDIHEKQLILKGSTTSLTDKEARLLALLASNPGQTLSRETILEEIWGEEGVQVISRNIDVLVSKLRKKLKEDESISIENVHGVGYKLILTPSGPSV